MKNKTIIKLLINKNMVKTKMAVIKIISFMVGGLLLSFFATTVFAAEGDVWVSPTTQNAGSDQDFSVEIHADTGGKNIGAFNFYLDFDPSLVTVDTTQGTDGLDKGADASNYTIMANPDDIANGHYRLGGMSASGFANGTDVSLATVHMKTTTGFTSGSASLTVRVNELSDELGQALSTGSVTGGTVSFVSSDTTPPTILSGQPSGEQLPGTSAVTLSVITDENSTCKYSLTPNVAYDSMNHSFATTGETEHQQNITGLTNGGSYDYYVRCADSAGNQDTADYHINFSVSNKTFGASDFSQLVNDWLKTGNSTADVNSDGVVNTRDLGIMMSNWGE